MGRVSQSSQVRVINIAKSLEKEYGIDTKIVFPLRDSGEKMVRTIAQCDVAIFHRIQGSRHTWIDSGYFETFVAAKRLGKKVIFDVDDAIYLNFPLITPLVAMTSSTVFAGSHALLERYRHFSRSVTLVPSAVDTELISPVPQSGNGPIVLGWHGSARVHLDNLLSLSNVLLELDRKYNIIFKILGTVGDTRLQQELQNRFGSVKLEFGPPRWFPYCELPHHMSDVNIGLYPLFDNEWNRAKCSMKLLEYMAMEFPTCSSRVGENNHIIKDGRNGFLASSDSEWIAKIGKLIDDASLRKEMGVRARASVLESYSLRAVTQSIEHTIRS